MLFYDNGRMKQMALCANGCYWGPYVRWFEDGRLANSSCFEYHGWRGPDEAFFESGQRKREIFYNASGDSVRAKYWDRDPAWSGEPGAVESYLNRQERR